MRIPQAATAGPLQTAGRVIEEPHARRLTAQQVGCKTAFPDGEGYAGACTANGVVHLAGTATWQCQREEAELVCAAVTGVRGIADDIALMPVPATDDIRRSIISAYRRNASLTRQLLLVDAPADGIVIFSGAVGSWGEHDAAVATAWSARGVTSVDDRILLAG